MTLTQRVEAIQQAAKTQSLNSHAWQHNKEVMKVLQDMGMLHTPVPKTYITERYISDPKNSSSPLVLEDVQFFCPQHF